MCGLAGALDPSRSASAEELRSVAFAMADALAHRGPDDRGAWVDAAAGIALGHRRLSILDLSPLGHQPMPSACGRWVIVFNGEVYNFRSLRAELEPRGHVFRGHSDTEIMLAAIAEWGLAEAVSRFVGMFAFALWDRQERRLHLVRDRLGIKPLYYGWSGGAFVFGSELKALRAHPRFEADLDRDALALFLRLSYVPTPHSIYRGIRKLPPGTILTLETARPETDPAPVAYWSVREITSRGRREPFRGDETEAIERLEAQLGEAVRLRLESDVPLGAFLSGGIDSSLVVALMQTHSSRPVRTFTIGFRERAYDEADHAAAVARHLGTDHTELTVEPAHALEVVPRIADWYDEPFADSSQVPTFLVSEMTRRHVTVALSGDGGDELFAGYHRYFWARSIARAFGWIPGAARRGLAAALRAVSPARIDALLSLVPERAIPRLPGDKVHKLAEALRTTHPGGLGIGDAVNLRLITHWESAAEMVIGAREAPGVFEDGALATLVPEFIPRLQLLDLLTYLPDDILTKVDRASMTVGLEARVPLLDHRVVELCASLPFSMKLHGTERKWLLRRVLARHVPPALTDRPKMGFGVPIDSWLRGPLRDWAESLLDERRLAREGILDPAPVRRRWDEHQSGRRNWHYPLWDVLVFQAWKERWL